MISPAQLDERLEAALRRGDAGVVALDYGRQIWTADHEFDAWTRRSRFSIFATDCAEVARIDAGADYDSLEPTLKAATAAGETVGYFAYELGPLLEAVAAATSRVSPRIPNGKLPDHHAVPLLRLLSLQSAAHADRSLERPLNPRERRFLDHESSWVPGVASAAVTSTPTDCAELSAAQYAGRVEAARETILAGGFYEINLTQRFRRRSTAPPGLVALRLRQTCAAPYWAYLDFGDMIVISASPELFLRRRGSSLRTEPIKGSARRGSTPASDSTRAAALASCPKNSAEHTMVVDLARNDLGRVARYGTVRVRARQSVRTFPTLHHLVSTVTARARRGVELPELLRATFPAASITGAPKIAVMNAITELEASPRGIYCGAIGRLAPNGDFDLSVAIRTLTARPAATAAQTDHEPREYDYEWGAGGAIVADSDPDDEWQECLLKARPLLEAILWAESQSACVQSPVTMGAPSA